jgi:hypothetical protein
MAASCMQCLRRLMAEKTEEEVLDSSGRVDGRALTIQ